MMDLTKLIVEDNLNFFAVNKPKGLIVNVSNTTRSETLQDLVKKHIDQSLDYHLQILNVLEKKEIKVLKESNYDSISKLLINDQVREVLKSLMGVSTELIKEFTDRNGIVHRLDKDTSGVILIAKNAPAFKELKSKFVKRRVRKTYYAITFGDIVNTLKGNDFIHVDLPLGRNPRHRTEFAIVATGRSAESFVYASNPYEMQISDYKESAKKKKDSTFSCVKVLPKTGRTHRIRVHLKALNHEILGDNTYMGKSQSKVAKKLSAPLMLHAHTIEFKFLTKSYKLSASFPKEFAEVVNNIFK